jgi:hypothetical protein
MSIRHCEERSDEAIQHGAATLDCFAELVIGPATSGRTRWLTMTMMSLISALALIFAAFPTSAQEFSDPYSIMAPERVPARHHGHKSPLRTRHLPPSGEKAAAKHSGREHAVIAHGSSGVVLPRPLPRTQLIPPEGGGTPLVRPAPQQQGVTVLPGANNPIPNLPHGPETFQDRASRCAFQQQLYNVPGNLGTQYMASCVQ